MDEFDYEEPKTGAAKIIPLIGKITVFALCLFFIGVVNIRSCMMRDTKASKQFLWTEEAVQAYAAAPDSFRVWELRDFNTNNLENIFVLTQPRFAEALGQFQFTMRFNTKVYDQMKEEYGVSELPETLFRFVLRDDKGRYYTTYQSVTDTHYQYVFTRMVFSGVDMSDVSTLTVFAYCMLDGEEPLKDNYCDTVVLYQKEGAKRAYNVKKEKPTGSVTPGMETVTVTFADSED